MKKEGYTAPSHLVGRLLLIIDDDDQAKYNKIATELDVIKVMTDITPFRRLRHGLPGSL